RRRRARGAPRLAAVVDGLGAGAVPEEREGALGPGRLLERRGGLLLGPVLDVRVAAAVEEELLVFCRARRRAPAGAWGSASAARCRHQEHRGERSDRTKPLLHARLPPPCLSRRLP